MDKKQTASACFQNGFNCSQSVFSAFSSEYGLETEQAYRVAAAFGGGMGRRGATCGAVTGALMVLGLKYGSVSGADKEARDITYQKVNDFAGMFTARNGSTLCNDLLGVDISTPEGREYASQQGRFKSLCPKYVTDAVEILDAML